MASPVDAVTAAYAALGRDDLDAAMPLVSPSIVCHDRPSHPEADTHSGRESLIRLLEQDREVFDGMTYRLKAVTQLGDWLLVVVIQRGTARLMRSTSPNHGPFASGSSPEVPST